MDKNEIIKLQKLLGIPQDGIVSKETSKYTRLWRRTIRKKSINKMFKQITIK